MGSCLVVSRHELLEVQKKDIESICKQVSVVPELPNDQNQFKQLIQPYDIIIGTIPLTLQIQVLQSRKTLIVFVMTSLGVASTEDEANKIASQYPFRTVIIPPTKYGEKYRISRYDGLKIIKDIKVIDEWLIQHQT